MNYDLDWTKKFDQNIIAEKAIYIVEQILDEIHKSKSYIFKKHNLQKEEISFIFIYPIFKATNIFIDRLLIASENQKSKKNIKFPLFLSENKYFENTALAILNYYYNSSITFNLLNELSFILNKNYISESVSKIKKNNIIYKKTKLPFLIKIFLKFLLKKKDKFIFQLIKPKFLVEKSHWFEKLNSFWFSINFNYHEFRDDKKKIDTETRLIIKNICEDVFSKNFENICLDSNLDLNKNKQISKLFSSHVDQILALPLIEGFSDRLDYYLKFLKNSKLKFIKAFTGLSYDDNFKIFSLAAKRINKDTNFIINSHGLNNYGYGNRGFHFSTILKHADFYLNYGKYFDWDYAPYKKKTFKAINLGSTYFNSLKKWKNKRNKSRFKLLYPSGPLMVFKTDLQEISPEKNLSHRNNILTFLGEILKNYDSVDLIYKPFPGTFSNDPITNKLSNWIKNGRIRITGEDSSSKLKLKDYYHKSDLVLWDSISTGFGECVASNVPVIVFNNKFEYQQTSNRGKFVNDELSKSEVQFFEINLGLKIFDKIFNNVDDKKKKLEALQILKDDKISPTSYKEWQKNFKKNFKF